MKQRYKGGTLLTFLFMLLLTFGMSSQAYAQTTLLEYMNVADSESLSPTNVEAGILGNDLELSAGTFNFGSAQAGTWTRPLPYAQGNGGWGAGASADGKYFSFVITGDGSTFTLSELSFEERATGAGPSAITVTINGVDVFNDDVPDSDTRLHELDLSSFSEFEDISSADVRIIGWDNGSRGTSGNGQFRVNGIIVEGDVSVGGPFLSVSPSSLSGFGYNVIDGGPSDSQSFTVNAGNLDPADAAVTVTAPTGFEVSADDASFSPSVTLNASGGELSGEQVFVRLEDNLDGGSYSGTVTVSGGSATTANVSVSGTVLAPVIADLPIMESFDNNDLGVMTTENVEGSRVWGYAEFGGRGYANANGFNTGEVERTWLISPGFDLDDPDLIGATLNFETAYNFGSNDADNHLKLFWSNDYVGFGDPTEATWNELSFTQPTTTNTWVESGTIDLSAATGTVYIGFEYLGSPGGYREWRVDEIEIRGILGPEFLASDDELGGFSYMEGFGPSTAQEVTISGDNLDPADGTVEMTVDGGFEISLDGNTFSDMLSASYSDNEFGPATVFVRLADGLDEDMYTGTLTTTGGGASLDIDLSGMVAPPPPFVTEEDSYFEDFESFDSFETLPNGWVVSDESYGGDWGTGFSAGLRGNDSVLGYQHTGSSGLFTATLMLVNNTGRTITELDVSYLGRVERAGEGRSPEWTVEVNGMEVADLFYSTEAGEDQMVATNVGDLSIEDGELFTISWSSDRGLPGGASKQIGISDVSVTVPEPPDMPILTIMPEAVEFGEVAFGFDDTRTLTLQNTGDLNLVILGFEVSGSVFDVNLGQSTLIAPGESVSYDVVFTPDAVGSFSETLTIESNDGMETTQVVELTGEGVNPAEINIDPEIVVSNTEVDADRVGDLDVQQLTITNDGDGRLDFEITGFEFERMINGNELEMQNILVRRAPVVDGEENSKANFERVTIGKYLAGELDKMTSEQRAIIADYNSRSVESDGITAELNSDDAFTIEFESLTLDGGEFILAAEGLVGEMSEVVADFVIDEAGGLTWANDFAILFTTSEEISTESVVLQVGGLTNYGDPSVRLPWSGGGSGDAGTPVQETVTLDEALDVDGLYIWIGHGWTPGGVSTWSGQVDLVGIGEPVPFLGGVEPSSGSVDPGQSVTVDITFDPNGLTGGTYTQNLSIFTNDPVTPFINVPTVMNVTGVPVISADPMLLDFGPVSVGDEVEDFIALTNTGSDDVVINFFSTDRDAYIVVSEEVVIAPDDTYNLDITFAPALERTKNGTLLIFNNTSESPLIIQLRGSGVREGEVAVEPEEIEAFVEFEGVAEGSFMLLNNGIGDYSFSLSLSETDEEPEARPTRGTTAVQEVASRGTSDENVRGVSADVALANAEVNDLSWVTFTPSSGDVEAGDELEISFEVNAAGQEPGVYEIFLIVESDAANGFFAVPFTITVGDAPPVEVDTIGEMLAMGEPDDGVTYRINGEVVITFNNDFRGRKVVVDQTAGLVLDDPGGVLPREEFSRYDGLTGLTGTLSEFNGLIQFTPSVEITEPSSSGNTVYPILTTIPEIEIATQGQLVMLENVTFEAEGQFSNQTSYTITDAEENTIVMRTDRIVESIIDEGEESYIGTDIPEGPVNIIGYIGVFNSPQITMRILSDIVNPAAISTFDLQSPADGAVVELTGAADDPVTISWSAATGPAISYSWAATLPELNMMIPFLNVESDNNGGSTNLTFTLGELNELLEFLGLEVGEQITLKWTVYAESGDAIRRAGQEWEVTLERGVITSAEYTDDVPVAVELHQNYPNPFNPTTNIVYALPHSGDVRLDVFNIQGQRVATLVDGQRSAGYHTVTFDASRLASGVYLYRLQAGSYVKTQKMMLVK